MTVRLPEPYLIRHHGKWCVEMRVDGKRKKHTIAAATREGAEAELLRLRDSGLLNALFPPSRLGEVSDQQLRRIFSKVRASAAARKIPFSITVDDLRDAYTRSDGKCAVSGIAFDRFPHGSSGARPPFGASLDRIDCQRGYAPDNIRFVCTIVNCALGDWGESVLRRVALGITLQS